MLTHSRQGVAWEALGHALAAYEAAVAYAGERRQFGRPIAAFQLVQDKLSHMLADITSMQLLCLRLAHLDALGRVTLAHASLAKLQTAAAARRVCALARDVLGGNGILLEYHVARHLADVEASYTYEGTDSVQSLIVGREITGLSAFAAFWRVGAPISRNRAPCATAGGFGAACTICAKVRFNGGRMSQHPAEIQEAEAEFAIEERREGIRVLVGMSGNLDFTAAPQLGDAIDRLLEARAHELWVDLRDLESIDSTGLAALTSARRRADAEGAKLRLVVERGPVRDVLELGRMDPGLPARDRATPDPTLRALWPTR